MDDVTPSRPLINVFSRFLVARRMAPALAACSRAFLTSHRIPKHSREKGRSGSGEEKDAGSRL